MKSNRFSSTLSIVFFLLTLALALFSWIGNVYGMSGIQSLLSTEGIRWVLGHVMENYVQTPALGMVLILFMGVGIGLRSGLYDAIRRFLYKGKLLSRRERRALTLSLGVLGLYLMSLGIVMLLPWNLFLSVTGGWAHSPFSKGCIYLLSLGIGLSGMVYGYITNIYRTLWDVVQGMSFLIARQSSYFVTLFFVVQFFSSLEYVGWIAYLGWSEEVLEVIFQLCCYLPVFLF